MTNTLFVLSPNLDGKFLTHFRSYFRSTSSVFPVCKPLFLVKLVKSNIEEDVSLQDAIRKVKKSVQDRSIGHQNLSLNHPALEHHQPDQFYQKQKQTMMTHHMNAIAESPAATATMCKFSMTHNLCISSNELSGHRTDQNGQVDRSDGKLDFLLWPR